MYKVRLAKDDEFHIIQELNEEFFGKEDISDPRAIWWIVFHENEPIGYAGMRPSSQYQGNVGYLFRAGIATEHRGKGLHKRLVRVRCKYAKRLGWNWMRTDTRDNPQSSNSLIACGFKLFRPRMPWAFIDSLYWFKSL